MLIRILQILIAFFSSIATAVPVEAQSQILKLEPSSKWMIDYADDSCRLSRQFGTDKEKVIAIFSRFAPGDEFQLTMAGKPVELRGVTRKASVRFGPAETEQQLKFGIGNLGNDMPALIFLDQISIAAPEEVDKKNGMKATTGKYLGLPMTAERKAAVTQLFIGRPLRRPIKLKLGAMDKPFAALSTCIDELLTHWGIDVAKHKNLTMPVRPAGNPGRWVTPNDYPRGMLMKRKQAIVHFRLSVDENGKASACHIQQSTRPMAFDDAVCRALMRKAKFQPALDKDSEPIASYFRSTVVFTTR